MYIILFLEHFYLGYVSFHGLVTAQTKHFSPNFLYVISSA